MSRAPQPRKIKDPYAALPKGAEPVTDIWRALDIAGRTWTVHFTPEGSEPSTNGATVAGYCDKTEQHIAVSSAYCREQQRQTLLHEVGHAIIYMHQGHVISLDRNDIEESIVQIWESGWYPVLRVPANSWFTVFLLEQTPPVVP